MGKACRFTATNPYLQSGVSDNLRTQTMAGSSAPSIFNLLPMGPQQKWEVLTFRASSSGSRL